MSKFDGPYDLDFDFDAEGDPPTVYIVTEDGSQVIEIFEEPRCKKGEFSWESEDWEPGPFASRVLALLNANTTA